MCWAQESPGWPPLPAQSHRRNSRVRGCPQSTHGLFGLDNTSKVVKSKVYIIHSRHFPFSCLSSLPDKGCEHLRVQSNSRDLVLPPNLSWNFIHSPGLCPWLAQEMGRVIPVLFPALVLGLLEQLMTSQEPGKLGISMQAAPLPDLLAVFAIPSLQQLIKAPSKAIQLRYLSPGSCHNPKGQGSQGKHPHPTPRSRGWKRSSWEQPGSSIKQKPFQK